MRADFAIIGGTGVYDAGLLSSVDHLQIDTPFGVSFIDIGEYAGQQVAFLSRHGKGHAVPPHRVNYRANIAALRQLGVKQVLATAAVGSLKEEIAPGELLIVDDFIDMTKSRETTFYEGENGVVHIDMSDPYCGRLRRLIAETADRNGIEVKPGGVYVCTEGPRFETTAEIRMYARLGGDVVGMTSVPEVVLAKEAEMCYATVAIVTNYCTGIADSFLTHQEVADTMRANIEKVRRLFFELIKRGLEERTCRCPHALAELGSL
ncbi:S-methyl-5'-thioadenosine phosphorylase [Effusibacillus dendaii]|uniref:Purine nucleoside phosphorylase n=1 Tax=Effusibacillus dendaii TaxID=2743772 RepID=A0A7I8D7R9_9BACL|nr:S-methyl-5'-thioadenosine phosphorylase [Effusibacillus dendaii]BCJ85432.1 putative 6-oxopurine nucleoside phosphorylase [Effusibacillus dendaii]